MHNNEQNLFTNCKIENFTLNWILNRPLPRFGQPCEAPGSLQRPNGRGKNPREIRLRGSPGRHDVQKKVSAPPFASYSSATLHSYLIWKFPGLVCSRFPNTPADSLLSRRSQSNPLRRNCPNRGVPNCPAASLRYRTSDGSCNNLQHLWWGSAMSTMQRWVRLRCYYNRISEKLTI